MSIYIHAKALQKAKIIATSMVHCPSWIKQSQFNRLSLVQKVSGVILSRLTWQWLDHKNRPLYPSGYYVSWGKKSKLWFRNFLKEWRAVICLRRNKIFFSWLHKQWDMKSANTYVVTKCVFEQLFFVLWCSTSNDPAWRSLSWGPCAAPRKSYTSFSVCVNQEFAWFPVLDMNVFIILHS